MAEYAYNQSESLDSEESEVLSCLQNDTLNGDSSLKQVPEKKMETATAPSSDKSQKTESGGQSSASSPDKKQGQEEQKKQSQGTEKVTAPVKYGDPKAAAKMFEILAGKQSDSISNADLIFQRIIQLPEFGPKTYNLILKQMAEDKIAKEKIPNYEQLSDEEKRQKKEEFFANLDPKEKQKLLFETKNYILNNNEKELRDAVQKHIVETIQAEAQRGEFGEYSKKAYAIYIDEINKGVNSAAKRLVSQQLPFPDCPCPIKTPSDQNGPYSVDRFRTAIANGKAQCELPDYKNNQSAPGSADREELVKAENFLNAAKDIVRGPNTLSQVKAIKDQFTWLFEGKPPKGLMPSPELMGEHPDLKAAQEYINRALPVEILLEQLNDHAIFIKALMDNPDILGPTGPVLLAKFLKDFPGEAGFVDGKFRIVPRYPSNLKDIQENSGWTAAAQKWLEQVHSPMEEMWKACDFAMKNPDSVCYWGHVPAYGKDPKTGQEYNRAQYTYNAEPVKVKVVRPDGSEATEDRIKVTTCKQYQWAGVLPGIFGATNIGEPVVSGRATANGSPLDPDGKSLVLKGNQIRLRKDGIVEVRAGGEGAAKVKLATANGKSYELEADKAKDGKWFSILPGTSLSIAGTKVDLHNDVRFYRLDQTVGLRGNSNQLVLPEAAELPGRRAASAVSEFMAETVPELVDIGFAITGLVELRALTMAAVEAKEIATEISVRTAAAVAREISAEGALATAEVSQALANVARTVTLTEEAAASLKATRSLVSEIIATKGLDPAARVATGKSVAKHLGLGGLGIYRNPIEGHLNEWGKTIGNDRLGSQLYAARGMFMATDILASTGWTGGLGRGWSQLWGHSPELMKTALNASALLTGTKAVSDTALKMVDLYYGPETILEGKEEIHLFTRNLLNSAQNEAQAISEVQRRLSNFERVEHKLAEHLVALLNKEDREKIIIRLNNLDKLSDTSAGPKGKNESEAEYQARHAVEVKQEAERETMAGQSAGIFLYGGATQQEKLTAALELLKLRTKADGSLPDILGTKADSSLPDTLASDITDKQSHSLVTLKDVREFLLDFKPMIFTDVKKQPLAESFAKAASGLTGKLSAAEKEKLVNKTTEVLNLLAEDEKRQKEDKEKPEDDKERQKHDKERQEHDKERQEHVRYLTDVFKTIAVGKENVEDVRAAAGLGLLFLATDANGSIKQTLGDRQGFYVSLLDKERDKTAESNYWNMDKQAAQEAAIKAHPFSGEAGANISVQAISPIKEIVTAPEVVFYLQQQLARTHGINESENAHANKRSEKTRPDYVMSAPARLALADTLMRCGQIDSEQHGRLCLEIVSDPDTDTRTQTSILLDTEQHRLPQYISERIERAQNAAKNFIENKQLDKANAAVQDSLADIRQTLEQIANNEDINYNVRALAVATLSVSSVSAGNALEQKLNHTQREKEFAALRTMTQKDASINGSGNSSFKEVYFKGLLEKLNGSQDISSAERYRAARAIIQLNDSQQVPNLTNAQKEVAFDAVLHSLDITGGKPNFVRKTLLKIPAQERENAQNAIDILSNHRYELNPKQLQQLRIHVSNIFKLPNQANAESDVTVSPYGETALKMAAINNVGKIFASATVAERNAVVQALEKDIKSLRMPSATEEAAKKLHSFHAQILKEEIKGLAQLVQDTEPDPQALALRGNIIHFLKDLAYNESYQKDSQSKPGYSESTVSALQALNSLRPVDGLAQLCSHILKGEENIAVREEAEGIQKIVGHEDPYIYHTEYLRSKRDIQNALQTVKLSCAEEYINGLKGFPAVLLTTDKNGKRLATSEEERSYLQGKRIVDMTLNTFDYFTGLGNFPDLSTPDSNVEVFGEKSITQIDRSRLLEQHIKKLTDETLTTKDESVIIKNVNTLAYLMSSGGYPIAAPLNKKAVELAAQGWQRLQKSDNPQIKKACAPLGMLLVLHAPALSYPERHIALREFISNKTLSDKEKATVLSMAIEREIHRTPHNITNPHFKESQDYHLALLDALKPLQTTEQVPLLAAIIDGKSKSSFEKDAAEKEFKINYADGSCRSVSKQFGEVIAFSFKTKNGKEDKWVKDEESWNFYRESDLKDKKHPWACEAKLLENGDFVITDLGEPKAAKGLESYGHDQLAILYSIGKAGFKSPGGTLITDNGSQTTYTRDGAVIVEVPLGKSSSSNHTDADFWVQATYADGSIRWQECDGTGRGIGTATFKSAIVLHPNDPNSYDYDVLAKLDPLKFPREWLRDPPAWLRELNITQPMASTGFDRNTNSFWRLDLAKDGRSYRTRVETNGSKVMETNAIAKDRSQASGTTTLLATASRDNDAAHPMPLVRQKALSLLASITQAPQTSGQFVKVDTSSLNSTVPDLQIMRERYSATKLAIESSRNNNLTEFKSDFISKRDEYALIDAKERDKYAKTEAENELSYWWLLGYKADYAKASAQAQIKAEQHLRRLQFDANNGSNKTSVTGQQARTALAFLAVNDRGFVGNRAIKAIAEIYAGNGAGSSAMREIVDNDLIGEPTIGTSNRQVLFEATQNYLSRNNNVTAQAKAAHAVCQILEIEYQTMPSDANDPAYLKSEKLQVDCFKFLKDKVHYHDGSMASARALAELSPSKQVSEAAKEFLSLAKPASDVLAKPNNQSSSKKPGTSARTESPKTDDKNKTVKITKRIAVSSLNRTGKEIATLPKITIDGI